MKKRQEKRLAVLSGSTCCELMDPCNKPLKHTITHDNLKTALHLTIELKEVLVFDVDVVRCI